MSDAVKLKDAACWHCIKTGTLRWDPNPKRTTWRVDLADGTAYVTRPVYCSAPGCTYRGWFSVFFDKATLAFHRAMRRA